MKAFKYIFFYLLVFTLLFILFENFFEPLYNIVLSIICAVIVLFLLSKTSVLNARFNTLFFIAVFSLIIFTPFVGKKEYESLEKRKLKEFPEWRWTNIWKFFKDYQAYFDDRFAYRNELINLNGKIRFELLNGTQLTSNVAFGNDNWLFYSDKDYLNRVASPFTTDELKRFNYNLNVITKWFNIRGIKYYLFIAPVKPFVYDDMLPDYMKIRTQFSRYEQLKTYLKNNSTIQFISCIDELKEAKQYQDVYYKTDTHWNQLGAFIGYSKIINTIAKDFEEVIPRKANEYIVTQDLFYGGDLLGLLGYNSGIEDVKYFLEPKDALSPILKHKTNLEDPTNGYEKWEMKTSKNNLKIFVVRDSFSEHYKIFFSSNFRYSMYAWMNKLPAKIVVDEKPNIVLHEMLERFTSEYLELPTEIKNDTAFVNQFNIEDY